MLVSNNLKSQRAKQLSMKNKSDLSAVIADGLNPNRTKFGQVPLRRVGAVFEDAGNIFGTIDYYKKNKLKFKSEINHSAGRKHFTITKFDKNDKPGDIFEYFG